MRGSWQTAKAPARRRRQKLYVVYAVGTGVIHCARTMHGLRVSGQILGSTTGSANGARYSEVDIALVYDGANAAAERT